MNWHDHTPSYKGSKRGIKLWEVGAVWLGGSIRRSPSSLYFFRTGELISTKLPANSSVLLPCIPNIFNSESDSEGIYSFFLEQHLYPAEGKEV